jgi:hypothetical protein
MSGDDVGRKRDESFKILADRGHCSGPCSVTTGVVA